MYIQADNYYYSNIIIVYLHVHIYLYINIQASTVCLFSGLRCRQRKQGNKVFVNTVEGLPMTKVLHHPGGAGLGILGRYYGSRMQPLQLAQSQSKQV